MTTKTIKCYKGLPIKVNCKAKGYWDYNEVKTFDATSAYNITMKSYDGLATRFLNSNVNPKSIDFETSFLPDYTYVNGQTAVLMPYADNKTYYDTSTLAKNVYVRTGGCTITKDNQCTLSGTSSYFNCTKPIPSNATKIKAVFKLNLTTNTASQIIMKVNNSGNLAAQAYVQSTSRYKGYFGAAVGGVTALTANTTYWFGILEDATTIKGYLLADNGTYTLDTLPDFATDWTEEWSQTVTSTYTYKGAQELGLFNNNSQYWQGNIDLNNCKIWVDDQDFWYYNMESETPRNLKGCLYNYTDTGAAAVLNCFYYNNRYLLTPDNDIANSYYLGTVEVPAHDLYNYTETPFPYYDNFTINGTLTLNQETGIVSGFSDTNYIETNYTFTPPAKTPWVMRAKFKHTTSGQNQYIFCAQDYQYGPYIRIYSDNKLGCGISNGNQLNEIKDTEALTLNSTYTVEWVYDGDKTYTLQKQIEGGEVSIVGTYQTEEYVSSTTTMKIGTRGSSYFRGEVDLADTYISINNKKSWEATTTHYKGNYTKI